jgi:hypothetical protein
MQYLNQIQPVNQERVFYNNGLNLTWENLNVIFKKNSILLNLIRKKTNEKTILSNQFGQVSKGELVGLLGSR